MQEGAGHGLRRPLYGASGRTEAVALCPGLPSVRDQERRDMAQPGAYSQDWWTKGSLIVAQGQSESSGLFGGPWWTT